MKEEGSINILVVCYCHNIDQNFLGTLKNNVKNA